MTSRLACTGFPRTREAFLLIGGVLLLLSGCGERTAALDLPAAAPIEAASYAHLTPSAEVLLFAQALAEGSHRVTLDTLGSSIEGRAIPYLRVGLGEFGSDRTGKVMVLAFAQQHGNEPAGKEGALALALELARGDHDDLLQRVDLILVPQLNPDGADEHQRQNAASVDLNRSHLILNGREVEALRELYHRWEPEVTVDIHEYFPWSGAWLDEGWLRLWDMQFGLPTNLNTDPTLRRIAEEEFLPFAIERMEAGGFTAHNYIVGSPQGVRWSTTNVNDGRQGLAILGSLSFIFEGKRSEPLAEDAERRTAGQRLALETLLRFSADRREEVLAAVHAARDRARSAPGSEFVLTMHRERGSAPLRIPVLAVERESDREEWLVGDTATAEIESFFPAVVAVRRTTLPEGYLIPAGEGGIVSLLERHQVETEILRGGETMEVERLSIVGFETEELEAPTRLPSVERDTVSYRAAPDDVFVPMRQLRSFLVATALEPESMHGFVQYGEFSHLAREGEYPVLRVLAR